MLPTRAARLRFDLGVLNAGPGDHLDVRFAGQLLLSINLTAPGDVATQEIDLSAVAGQNGDFEFAFYGPLLEAAVVRLDNFAVVDASYSR